MWLLPADRPIVSIVARSRPVDALVITPRGASLGADGGLVIGISESNLTLAPARLPIKLTTGALSPIGVAFVEILDYVS